MHLLVEHDGPVATMTLNRPEAMNAMTRELYDEMTDTLRALDRDPEVKAIVVTGAGDRAFSAGADLRLYHTGEEQEWQPWSAARWDLGASFGKPLIAAVNGYAVAGGLELALVCDIRVASVNAKFGAPEVRWGLLGPVDTYYLPRAIGLSNAMLLLLTGDFIDANEALRVGLVSDVVAADELLPRAKAIAGQIAEHPVQTVRMVKEMTLRGLDVSIEAHLRFSEALERIAESSGTQKSRSSDFGQSPGRS